MNENKRRITSNACCHCLVDIPAHSPQATVISLGILGSASCQCVIRFEPHPTILCIRMIAVTSRYLFHYPNFVEQIHEDVIRPGLMYKAQRRDMTKHMMHGEISEKYQSSNKKINRSSF